MPYSSISRVPCSSQPLSWSIPSPRLHISQNPVNVAGNGTPGQHSGYHIEQICRTSASHARCSSTVAVVLLVRETVTATELDSEVAVCASVKEVAQIMTKKAELIMAMMCAVYYPWTFDTNIFSTIKLKHCCRKHYVQSGRIVIFGLAYTLGLIWIKVTIQNRFTF